MRDTAATSAITELCRLLGVQRLYRDGTGAERAPDDAALLAVLCELGAPAHRHEDAPEALRALRTERVRRPLAPAHALTAGDAVRISVRSRPSAAPPAARIVTESGNAIALRAAADGPRRYHGERLDAWTLHGPPLLEPGYHRLEADIDGILHSSHVLCAPAVLPQATPGGWAIFAPLYALHTDSRDELATFTELARFGAFARERGADWIGTLPLLAGFLDEPLEPSPYSPLTRCFWNELYIDATLAPELGASAEARDLVSSAEYRRASAAAVDGGRIDYAAAMKLRRRVLELLAAAVDAPGNEARRRRLEHVLEADEELRQYAAFRAAAERHRTPWTDWPDAAAGSADDGTRRYHAYAQWLAREQVEATARDAGAGLYLDLPIGSHRHGYDTWRWRESYALAMSAGAPPDALFAGGQNWAFPPLHPERVREHGYAPLRAALRHHFTCASVLRVDHVLGFHRLFWIAPGFGADNGVYVCYRARELWSVLAIEADRAGSAVVGEDLGTVPGQVRRRISRLGALRMHVVPFETTGDWNAPLHVPDEDCLACLGTHDTATFAAWWKDTGEWGRHLIALLGGNREHPEPALEAQRVLLSWLGGGRARVVLANLEDTWLEPEPQNRPGTEASQGNWQRRTALSLEEIARDERVRLILECLERARSAVRPREDDGSSR